MRGSFQLLIRAERAAVAPFVAMSLFFLIGMGGVAFDYAHLAALDTELQQAADHAALAAATQLDRSEDAIDHATAAVTGTAANRLAANLTKFANDGDADGSAVTIDALTFCSEFDDSEPVDADACEETTEGSQARYVMVTTSVRTAEYALTPVVNAISGSLSASAVAGIESNICNVAPLLVCLPSDDLEFPGSEDIGRGLVLKPFGGQDSWAPGNYGLLDFGNGNPAVKAALAGHGLNGCQSTDDNQTEPGTKEVTDAINTRMDHYDGYRPADCDLSDGAACPAKNTGKDMVRTETYTVQTATSVTTAPAAPSCGGDGAGFPGTLTLGTSWSYSEAARSFERDSCHYSDSCPDRNFGDGSWDFNGYMAANHPTVPAADRADVVGGTTRYAVYQWELETDQLGPRQISQTSSFEDRGGGRNVRRIWTIEKQCAYSRPLFASSEYPEQKDRRVIPIVAADCTELNGRGQAYEDYRLLRVFDIFLTEPSLTRTGVRPTDNKEIYGEVMGPAETVSGGSGFQYYARNRPYLVR